MILKLIIKNYACVLMKSESSKNESAKRIDILERESSLK